MDRMNGQSLNIVSDNIQKLKQIFPEVFNEDKVDFEKLEAVLGEYKDNGTERYNFSWPGKSKAIRISQTPSTGTLRPCKEESKDWDTTQNLYIEGDNLEVLKLLQKSYYGKVKMIYIDPPYNTGNDFVYKDDFKDNIENYLEVTGQKDSEGNKTTTNTESNGRYHSNWLNMMYPRLKLARNLLGEDGVIFISIDDNEVGNLKKVADEIFGESNFIGETVRVSSPTQNISKYISIMHDYTLIYCKNKLDNNGDWKVPKNNVEEFEGRARKLINSNLSSDEISKELRALVKYPRFYDFDHYYYCDEQGVFRAGPIGGVQSGNTTTEIIHPITKKPCKMPKGGWRYKESEIERLVNENKLYFGSDENIVPQTKLYLHDYLMQIPKGINFFDTQSDVRFLYDIGLPFDFPKPIEYISYLAKMIQDKEALILDFFSGSATTAHGIIKLNAEDGGKRKFIMVQIPEAINEKDEAFKYGYKKITEIGKERIRIAGEKVKEENKDKEGIEDLDIGFKVFKLDSSNINRWDSSYDQDLEHNLLSSIDNIKEGRSEEDILYEILLKYGIDLNMPIEEHDINGKKVFDIGFGAIIACLDDNISLDVVEGIGKLKEELNPDTCRVVFMDNGFSSDSVKTNAVQILKRFNIEDVKSI